MTVHEPIPAAAATVDAPRRAWKEWPFVALALLLLAAAYGLLLNRYWSPGGDSELFTVIARNLVRGEGYTYNGQPVIVTPPGWPLVLAGLLKISPTFLWLKLCLIGMMLGSAGLNYRVLRRFASPRLAATVVVLAGLLGWVYPLTMWLHTEALFLLMTSAAMLLAARLGEGRGGWGHVAGLVILSFLMVFTRWPGLFVWPILAALAAGPHWRPARGPRWAAVGLTLVVMAGGFVGTRQGMLWYASRTVTTDELTGEITTADGDVLTVEEQSPEGQVIDVVTTNKRVPVPLQYWQRFVSAGQWVSDLLWPPLRFGTAVRAVAIFSGALGWVTIGLLVAAMIAGWRRGELLWAALAAYCGTVVMIWPNPNARYLVPVAPLLILGVILGVRAAGRWLRTGPPPRWAWRMLAAAAIYAVLLVGARVALRTPLEPGYFTPVAPLLLFAGLLAIGKRSESNAETRLAAPLAGRGAGQTRPASGAAKRRTESLGSRLAVGLFVGTVLLNNAALWGVDVAVAHASDYYGTYWGGLHASLVSACKYLNEHEADDRAIAVSERYQNLGHSSYEPFGPRAATLLTDRVLRRLPHSLNRPPNGKVLSWVRNKHVDYYLFQDRTDPWVVWHFRLPPWLQRTLAGPPKVPAAAPQGPTGGWILYELVQRDGARTLEPVDVPPVRDWPTRVPGL